jgi:hypothetical protein
MDWNDEVTELHEKFNHLFECRPNDEGKMIPVRGIETGPGWKKHILNFLARLEWISANNRTAGINADFKIFQIKEKFGDCCCYVEAGKANDIQERQMQEEVARLEAKCSLTCENCGKLEYDVIKRVNGWIYCVCDECQKNWKSKKC